MSEVKWIKITTNIFDDEKIRLIDSMPDNDAIIVIWFKLLILAGKSNNEGVLALSDKLYYTEEMLATIFNRKLSTVKLALETFEKLGMIEKGDFISITNWGKYQSTDKLKQIKTQQNERQQLRYYRTKLKELGINIDDENIPNTAEEIKNYYQNIKNSKILTLGSREAHAPDIDIEEDIELDKEIEKEIIVINNNFEKENNSVKEKPKRDKEAYIIPPTLEMVKAYCEERNNGVDAVKFISYYSSIGWVVNKAKMKNWKMAVITWERNEKERKATRPQKKEKYIELPKDIMEL